MFVVTAHGKKQIWHNAIEDNFIDATADHFGIKFEDLVVEYVDPAAERAMRAARFKDDGASFVYDLSQDGKLTFKKAGDEGEVIGTFDLKRVARVVRDQAGKFVRNELEG